MSGRLVAMPFPPGRTDTAQGEFGHLLRWQAYLRGRSDSFDETTVIDEDWREPLYRDFADFCPVIEYERVDLSDCTIEEGHRNRPDHLVRYIPFGTKQEGLGYDLLLHMRNRECRPKANWPLENWEKFRDAFASCRMASIGTREQAMALEGTEDLRDIPLDRVMDVMASSGAIVGPSSGPMHLASLCRLPHIVWGGLVNTKVRYMQTWNPFGTKLVWCNKGHDRNPSVDRVIALSKDFLRKLDVYTDTQQQGAES